MSTPAERITADQLDWARRESEGSCRLCDSPELLRLLLAERDAVLADNERLTAAWGAALQESGEWWVALNSAKSDIDDLGAQVEDLERERDQLRQELAETRAKLAAASRALASGDVCGETTVGVFEQALGPCTRPGNHSGAHSGGSGEWWWMNAQPPAAADHCCLHEARREDCPWCAMGPGAAPSAVADHDAADAA